MIFDEMNPRGGYHLMICFDNTFLICCGENMSERFFPIKAKMVFIDFRSWMQGFTLITIGSIHVLEVLSIKMILSKWRLSKWRLPGLTDNEEKSIFKINYDISSIDKTMVWNVKQK